MFKTLRSKFIYTNIAIFISIILLLISLFYYFESKELIDYVKYNSLKATQQYSDEIGSTVNNHINQLKFLATEEKTIQLNMDYIMDELDHIRTSNSLFLNNIFISVEGNFLDPDNKIGDVTDRDYFPKLLENNRDYIISNPIIAKLAKTPIVLLIVPIINENNELMGAVAGSIELNSLSGELENVKHAGDSYGWIIDNSGLVIGHPNPEYPMKVFIQSTDGIGYKGLTEIGKQMIKTSSGVGEYYDDNRHESKIVTYSEIPYTNGWKLGITTVKSDVFKPLNKLVVTLLTISGISLIPFIIIVVYSSSRIISPIIDLTNAVKESEKNNLSKINYQNKYAEVNHLVLAYNSMAEKTKINTELLENLVNVRTEELNILNIQLDTHNKRLNTMNEQLFDIAIKDELTGLFNRVYIIDALKNCIIEVDTNISLNFSLLFIDLDNFKYYNDTFGHEIGDKILIDFSNKLNNLLRNTDTVARYGGDEFLVILADSNESQAAATSNKIQLMIEEINGYESKLELWTEKIISIPSNKKLGISIGISTYDKISRKTYDELISDADDKMYEIKKLHKTIHIKSPQL